MRSCFKYYYQPDFSAGMSCQSNIAEGVVRGRRREDDRSEEVGDGSFTMEAIQQQLQRLVVEHDAMRNEMAEL